MKLNLPQKYDGFYEFHPLPPTLNVDVSFAGFS
jgi:hypothetical protein